MPKQTPFLFNVQSVGELTREIKQLLESNFRDVLVEGELSNVNQSRNGHWYFTLKDSDAQLPCVIWRTVAGRLEAEPRDGMQVVLGGDVQVYEPHGRYQMVVQLLQQAGLGRLQQKFEELKASLKEEGLFDESRKKPLPPFPFRIGVVTSETGAAFHDIYSTFSKRWPLATLYLHHASVQGVPAAAEIASAINYFSSMEQPVDLLIVGRGGGSLEDLWPFNEEIVARALAACPIPTISAVGHEVDYSISDFVADMRAATPTQAALIAAPDIHQLLQQIDDMTGRMETTVKNRVARAKEYVHRLGHAHALLKVQDMLRHHQTKVNALKTQLQTRMVQRHTALTHRTERADDALKSRFHSLWNERSSQAKQLALALESRNPKAPLQKGFTRILQNGDWVRSRQALQPNRPLTVEWKDGKEEIEPG
ncbi:MAG: exodeoxyribonuclease VII large subunit [Balneolaceae bacterium]